MYMQVPSQNDSAQDSFHAGVGPLEACNLHTSPAYYVAKGGSGMGQLLSTAG